MEPCGGCGRSDPTVHAYQLIVAGRPMGIHWRCRRCYQLATEMVDLRPLPAWRERALAGDPAGARITGGVA